MTHPWQVTVWGVRGSLPAPGGDFLEYGGNTACISLDYAGGLVVLDAGTGLIPLAEGLKGCRRLDILISHLHLDHLMGLCACPLLFEPEGEIHLYGPENLAEGLRRTLGPPCWPLGPQDVKAAVRLHPVQPGASFPLAGGLTVAVMAGCHPGGSLLYRLDEGEQSLVYGLDCEMEGNMPFRLAEFAQNTRLLIWDASFAPGKAIKGWGHSTWAEGLDLGGQAGAETVLMTHYSRNYTDEFLREQEAMARKADPRCRFAKEGMVIDL